jgi:hypothetical protein
MYTLMTATVWLLYAATAVAMIGHTAFCIWMAIDPPKDWTGPQ